MLYRMLDRMCRCTVKISINAPSRAIKDQIDFDDLIFLIGIWIRSQLSSSFQMIDVISSNAIFNFSDLIC